MTDFVHASALDLLQRLRRHELSCVELLDAFITRIEGDDRAVNAVVVRDFDRARDPARAPTPRSREANRGARCTACR
jgi:amidase